MPDDNNLTNTPPVTNEGVAEEIVDAIQEGGSGV